ncbi:hypothetical protein GCM10009827_086960 [Dactylosporangium maewongense]|uniref:UbiC transcription regulator-associated domain-containing protein n=1 Tax=Dactylosporangium maewongense TaxID=634393 RepID=A0ABN2C4Z7_9ACTN
MLFHGLSDDGWLEALVAHEDWRVRAALAKGLLLEVGSRQRRDQVKQAAKLLGLEPGDPVLVGYQKTFDQHDQCFDVGRQLYRGDAYRFQASLFRF